MQNDFTPTEAADLEEAARDWARRKVREAARTLEPALVNMLDDLLREGKLWVLRWYRYGERGQATAPAIKILDGGTTRTGKPSAKTIQLRKDGSLDFIGLCAALRLAAQREEIRQDKARIWQRNFDQLVAADPKCAPRFRGCVTSGNSLRPSTTTPGAATLHYDHSGVKLEQEIRIEKLDDFVAALDAAAARIAEARVTFRP